MKSIQGRLAVLGLAAAAGACAAPAPPAAPSPGPAPAPAAATPAAPVREAPPAPLPQRPIQMPAFVERTLPNGLRMIVVEHHGQPVVNVDLYVRSGTAADPATKLGLASLTADVLTKGTRSRSARQIAESIEGVGGSLSAGATQDYTAVEASVLTENLPLAFELLSEVALRPAFPATEVETSRKRMLSGLQSALAQPGPLAQRRFAAEVYGAAHPYGRSPVPATVSTLQRNDLVGFHRTHFTPDNSLLVVSGDVTPERAEELARRYFGGWTGKAPAAATLPEPGQRQRTAVSLVNRPGSVQSTIYVGHPGIRPDNPDYFALMVLNQVLGGGPESRLFQVLRQQKGWTYGAYSSMTRPRDVGFFRANAEVRTPVTDSAVVEFLRQMETVRNQPVPQAELEAAKSYLAGSYPLGFETPGQIANRLASYRLLGLPADYMTEYRDRISAVTAEDVQRVARQYLHPQRSTIVVVGDAAQIHDKLQAIAPVTAYNTEGQRIQPSDFQVRASTEKRSAAALRPVTLEYQVVAQGNPVGTATISLAREGGGWSAMQVVKAGPLTQEQGGRFTADFTPISARQTVSQGPVQIEIDLKYENGKVTGTAKLPPQMGGEKAVNADVPAGTVFSGMDQWVLTAADLAPGKTIDLPVFEARAGSTMNATFRVTGTEQVTVPAGTFATYRVEGSVGPQSVSLWLRQDAPHVLVRQDLAGQPVSIVLQSVK